MLTLRTGTLTLRDGRLTVDALRIEPAATVRNDAEVYTATTVSEGTITGTGTLWAWWVTSEFIQGEIATTQTVIYYGDRLVDQRYVQLQFGSIFVGIPFGQGSVVG